MSKDNRAEVVEENELEDGGGGLFRMDRFQFATLIANTLAEHPEWQSEASAAISHGVQLGIDSIRRDLAKKDAAMLAALTLAKPGTCLDSETLGVLNKMVRAGIGAGTSILERDFIERSGQ